MKNYEEQILELQKDNTSQKKGVPEEKIYNFQKILELCSELLIRSSELKNNPSKETSKEAKSIAAFLCLSKSNLSKTHFTGLL